MLASATPDRASFVADDMIEDAIERLAFLRLEPAKALVIGDRSSLLAKQLERTGCTTIEADIVNHAGRAAIDMETPFPHTGYDFVAVIGLLDAVNDLPGALIHIRNALAPGGLAIASFVGGASLTKLRTAMFAADADRPAARIHPMVDPRAAPQLLQRAGWRDPVVDTHTLTVRYSSLDRLVGDLREQALSSALADSGAAIGKAARERARAAFLDQADDDGKVSESFEIITLTGRK